MKTENLILIGNPASGKSNYLGAGLGYMATRMNDVFGLEGTNQASRDLIDKVEYSLRKGMWLPKTGGAEGKSHFEFNVHFSTNFALCLESLRRKKMNPTGKTWRHFKLHVEDWAGEYFQELKLDEKKSYMEQFVQDSMTAKHVMVFFDGIALRNDETIDSLQTDLGLLLEIQKRRDEELEAARKRTFWGWLASFFSSHRRVMSIVVTKCDAFEPGDVFCNDSGTVDVSKVEKFIKEKFPSFNFASQYYETQYFCVSCVDNPDHRVVTTKRGTVPSEDWTLDDMKDQIGPLKWIFNHFN